MKRKVAIIGPQVKDGKLKTEKCNVFLFFNSSFMKRARALIFELYEGNIKSFVKFQYKSFDSKIR